MKINTNRLTNRLSYYFALGVGLVLAFFVLVVLFYVVFWGAVIGGVLLLLGLAKERFFPSKRKAETGSSGRIIEVEVKRKQN